MFRQQADDHAANVALLRQLYPQPPAFGHAADLPFIPPPPRLMRSGENSDVLAPLSMDPAELEYWTQLIRSQHAEAVARANAIDANPVAPMVDYVGYLARLFAPEPAVEPAVAPMVDYTWWEEDEDDWDVYEVTPQNEEELYATLEMLNAMVDEDTEDTEDEATDEDYEDPYSFLTVEEYEEYLFDRALSL